MIHLQGFVKSEYVQPVRWLQPGVLVLKQLTIFHENDAEASYEFTARFDPKPGKFQVTSKREVTADEETKNNMMARKVSRVFALLFWLLIPVAQIHAQTKAAMNAHAHAEFVQADTELNKTYERF